MANLLDRSSKRAEPNPFAEFVGTPSGAENPFAEFADVSPVKAKRTFGQAIYENVIGSGEVDTPGEKLGQYIRGGTAAVARGMADVPAMPVNLLQLATAGVEKLFGADEPSSVSRALERLPDTREMLASVPVIGPESEYVAPGLLGKYISTAGEFAGGAGAAAGPRAMLRYGAVPGVASEAAGQATEGTSIEPYARAGAALGASILATPRPTGVSGRVKRVDPERAKSAEMLMGEGVSPTAGQVIDSSALMRAEDALGPTATQLDSYTKAALRTAGNTTAKRATPDVLRSTQKTITDQMNRILDIDVPVPTASGQRVLQIADDYFTGAPGAQLPVALRRVAEELADLATRPAVGLVPGNTMRKWRTTLGTYTTSSQEMTREAAHALREVIDDLSETALNQLGRADDVAKLATARTQYRNFLTIADAATRGGRSGASGLLTPERLSSAAKRVLGRMNYATGRSTDLADLSRRGEMIIGAMPSVKPGGLRDVATAAGLGSAGAYGGFMGGGPVGAIAGGLAGVALPSVGSAMMRSGPVQSALIQPSQFGRAAATLPGILSNGLEVPQ
jgi:hypothetical protein